MRNFLVLFFSILFSLSVFAQKPSKKPARASGNAVNSSTANVAGEKEELEKAVAVTDAVERVKALQKFVARFPNSVEKVRALELIASARAETADAQMRAGNVSGGVRLFKLAVKDAPAPISDKLFADVILQIPTNLFFRGERGAATEIARAIEVKSEGNAKHLLGLATFYLGTENADEAKRLAEKAIALDANLPAAYQTLGLANRLNFNLEEAANAYSKALELDQNSIVSKRSLAEMKRALGRADEAVALYREILDKNSSDALASNGLILALFDAGKKAEAESEMKKSLEQNPKNLTLLVGAAYSYAARGDAARAVELAQKAVATEPRYVWGYIALARGYLRQNQLYEAERALLAARAHGNFPTLNYELAAVRAAGGFYREAAQELAKTFAVKDDLIAARLGGRVEKQAKSFIDLVSFERRASIFESIAADDEQSAGRLKLLLDFYQQIESPDAASEAEIADAAEKFVNGAGDDKMKLHRRLFAADYLLKKRKALATVAALIKSAPAEVDAALDGANASSAVLADELYESRAITIAQNQLVIVPEVQRQTLSNVLRGRIEEINGEILLQNNKPSEAIVRLKRALSVLPEKSAWWRSSLWRLGAALEADGKADEALAAYIKSYTNEVLYNPSKRAIIESLYKKVNGSLNGLDAKIGAKNISIETVSTEPQKAAVAKPTPEIAAKVEPKQAATPEEKRVKPAADALKKDKDENAAKSLFEPIIINVPKVENTTKQKTEEKSGAPDESKCGLTFSQESVSLVRNGGNLGILVGLDGAGDAKEIRAASSSAADVEVVFEPEIGAASNRAYFIFKSVSRNTGVFTVTFEAPCGFKKEFTVKVR